MSGLCQYSGAFGAPGTGAHSLRIGGLAAIDLLVTAGAAFLAAHYGLRRTDLCSFLLVFLILLLVAIPVHELFCVNTRLNAALFGRQWPSAQSGGQKAL